LTQQVNCYKVFLKGIISYLNYGILLSELVHYIKSDTSTHNQIQLNPHMNIQEHKLFRPYGSFLFYMLYTTATCALIYYCFPNDQLSEWCNKQIPISTVFWRVGISVLLGVAVTIINEMYQRGRWIVRSTGKVTALLVIPLVFTCGSLLLCTSIPWLAGGLLYSFYPIGSELWHILACDLVLATGLAVLIANTVSSLPKDTPRDSVQ
jgi:hypothetical protein